MDVAKVYRCSVTCRDDNSRFNPYYLDKKRGGDSNWPSCPLNANLLIFFERWWYRLILCSNSCTYASTKDQQEEIISIFCQFQLTYRSSNWLIGFQIDFTQSTWFSISKVNWKIFSKFCWKFLPIHFWSPIE